MGCIRIGNTGTYIVIDYCYENCASHEKPVDEWDVKLAVEGFGGMHNFDLGEI